MAPIQDPHKRITLQEVLFNSFLNPKLPIASLSKTLQLTANDLGDRKKVHTPLNQMGASRNSKALVGCVGSQYSKPTISARAKELPSVHQELQKNLNSPPTSPRPSRQQKTVITAGRLSPQTFRTPYGTISIQSSGSIIVDLREGERMKGRDGDFILEISPHKPTVRC